MIKLYAAVTNGVVTDLLRVDTTKTSATPGDGLPAAYADDVTSIAGITSGWAKNADGTFSAPAAATPAAVDLITHAKSALVAVFAAGRIFNVAASGQPALNVLCDGTNDTRADLGMLALFGQQSPTGTQVWVDDAGVSTTLTGAQCVTLASLAGAWIASGYAALGQVLTDIAASPPTVTSTAQIDTAFASL